MKGFRIKSITLFKKGTMVILDMNYILTRKQNYYRPGTTGGAIGALLVTPSTFCNQNTRP